MNDIKRIHFQNAQQPIMQAQNILYCAQRNDGMSSHSCYHESLLTINILLVEEFDILQALGILIRWPWSRRCCKQATTGCL